MGRISAALEARPDHERNAAQSPTATIAPIVPLNPIAREIRHRPQIRAAAGGRVDWRGAAAGGG